MTGPLAFLADRIAEINEANGWYDGDRTFGDDIALIHSEVSEAFEEYRAGRHPNELYYTHPGALGMVSRSPFNAEMGRNKPEGIPSELADIIIRVLDTAHRYGIDLDVVVDEKLAYNASRGYRHGGKVI